MLARLSKDILDREVASGPGTGKGAVSKYDVGRTAFLM
jgi:hypothetical protein